MKQLTAIVVALGLIAAACQAAPLPSPARVHVLTSAPITASEAPLVEPNFHAKVVVGDPNDPRRHHTSFTAGPNDPTTGAPLDQLGDWVHLTEPAPPSPSTGQAGSPLIQTASFIADEPALQDESNLCSQGSGVPDCIVFTYGWEALSPDAGTHTDIWCPSTAPYLASIWEPSNNTDAVPSDWQRDHWTITLWNFSPELDPAGSGYFFGVDYWGQNWNTVFGDTWNYAVFIGCGGTDAGIAQPE